MDRRAEDSSADYSLHVKIDVGWPSDDVTRAVVSGTSRTEVHGITLQLQELGNEVGKGQQAPPAEPASSTSALEELGNEVGEGQQAPPAEPASSTSALEELVSRVVSSKASPRKEFQGNASWSQTFSRHDVLALARKTESLMAAQTPDQTLSYTAHLRKPDSTLTGATLDDLESELDDAAWSHVGWVDVNYHGRQEQHGDITLSAFLRARHPRASQAFVQVHGLDRTAVEGISAQLQEFGDDLLREGKATAAVAARARLGRLLNNPWLVTIVGGVIVVIAGIILAAVLT